jgi:CheY-like chemotaxis protein
MSSANKPLPFPEDPSAGGEIALVIDNDPTAREWLSRKLRREGMRVAVAEGGEDGLRQARELRPAVIFLDIVMPGMDGWAVLKAVKADADLAAIPVVMVTMLDERKKSLSLGVADFLLKPVDATRLAGVLKHLRAASLAAPSPPAGPEDRPDKADGDCPQPGPVLVVEDDPINREILVRLLRKHGRQVLEADNGRAALRLIAATTPDLIVLDLMLPEMDGLTFIHEFRKLPACRRVPIVVLTAKDLSPEDRHLVEANVRKVFQKGACSREDLLKEITA